MSNATTGGNPGGYDPAFFAQLDKVEDRHFWFRARKRAVGTVLRQLADEFPPGFNVLELGCGNGDLLAALKPSVGVGVDFSANMLDIARHLHPDLYFVQQDVHELDLKDKLERLNY